MLQLGHSSSRASQNKEQNQADSMNQVHQTINGE